MLVWGRTQEEHDAHLHATVEKIQCAGITLNTDKCELSKTEVIFLGHVVSTSGISPDPSKTEAILKMKGADEYNRAEEFPRDAKPTWEVCATVG